MGDLNDSDHRLETITLFELSDYANGLVQKVSFDESGQKNNWVKIKQ
jgi:hypothetical protein